MTTDAAQRSLVTKVQRFLADLTGEEAALFAASIAGGIAPAEGVAVETTDLRGFSLLPQATTASAAPRPNGGCRWQAEGPGTLCYYCGPVRVQCITVA
jgi:hypothetical protein